MMELNFHSDHGFLDLFSIFIHSMGEYGKIPLVCPAKMVLTDVDRGFIQIPWDFTVSSLCDLLEEHLETTREALQRRRQRCLAAKKGWWCSHGKPSIFGGKNEW